MKNLILLFFSVFLLATVGCKQEEPIEPETPEYIAAIQGDWYIAGDSVPTLTFGKDQVTINHTGEVLEYDITPFVIRFYDSSGPMDMTWDYSKTELINNHELAGSYRPDPMTIQGFLYKKYAW